jgi:hypothetical protein
MFNLAYRMLFSLYVEVRCGSLLTGVDHQGSFYANRTHPRIAQATSRQVSVKFPGHRMVRAKGSGLGIPQRLCVIEIVRLPL